MSMRRTEIIRKTQAIFASRNKTTQKKGCCHRNRQAPPTTPPATGK